jgi:hypothetical protein
MSRHRHRHCYEDRCCNQNYNSGFISPIFGCFRNLGCGTGYGTGCGSGLGVIIILIIIVCLCRNKW